MERISTMSHATMIPGTVLSAFDASPVQRRSITGGTAISSHTIENPLWIIVIGMACFFGVAALLIVWG
jgi:hypothetical protein